MRSWRHKRVLLLLLAAGLMAGAQDCGHKAHVAAPVEPQYGTLAINSAPAGATILVDGTDYRAVTPDDFTLPAGAHRVAVSLVGHTFTPASTTLAVPAEGTASYTFLEYAPLLTPGESTHDFAAQALATTSASWCFSVTNRGLAASDSGAFALAGVNADQYAIVSGAKHPVLAPGASQQVCVAFHPTSVGAKTASVHVGAATVALSGTGYKVPCNLAPGESAHDFGPEQVGQAYAPWCFTITNDDASACADTLHVVGPGASEFAIVSGATYDLAPGASQQACVAFQPRGAGSRSASIAVGGTSVTLAGTGVGSSRIGAPSTPDGTGFGEVCTDSRPTRRLVVTNSGNLAGTVTASGGDTQFSVEPASATVAPGLAATFTVAYQPAVVGPAPATTITLADGANQWPTTFTGTGISNPVVDFTPTGGIVAHTGDPVQFNSSVQANGSPVTAYAWDFDDGGTSSLPNPTHRFTTGGTHNVTLMVTNGCGTSPVAAHAICIDEPAYLFVYNFREGLIPDYVTNIPGWGTTTPIILYRGTNTSYASLPEVVCANVFIGEMARTGRVGTSLVGSAEVLGVPGQSFDTASLPVTADMVSLTLSIGAPNSEASGPNTFVQVGACPAISMGKIYGNSLFCSDYHASTRCTTNGNGRVVWGLAAQVIQQWAYIATARLDFPNWYVCPQAGPQRGPLKVVDSGAK